MAENVRNVGPWVECSAKELVVAADHADLVAYRLDELGLKPTRDDDKRLGLSLLTLPEPKSPSTLDDIATRLRAWFRATYDGWTPTLELNPVLRGIRANGHVKGGSLKLVQPEAAPAASAPQADPALGRGVRIGLLDTKVFPHPDLAGGYLGGQSELLLDPTVVEARAGAGHGTFVAGLVHTRAPAAELHVRAGLGPDATATLWDVSRRLVEFADHDLDLLNLSFGCFTAEDEMPLLLRRAIDQLGPDVLVVASAGNHGRPADADPLPADPRPGTPSWPAAFDRVVAVGALDQDGSPAAFSPHGPWLDALAPGQDVVSTFPPGPKHPAGYARWSGTSFAAATVTGTVAAAMRPGQSAREAFENLPPELVVRPGN